MSVFFLQDRARYNLAIDYQTKNTSFIHLVGVLKQMGIKNHLFPLYTYDKDLVGIDPHTLTDPSIELALKMAVECKLNIWYYLRNVIRMAAQGGDAVPYQLHRGNLAVTWLFYAAKEIDIFCVFPRQKYKTTSNLAIISHLLFFAAKNFPMTLFAKDSPLVKDILGRLRDMKYDLPDYLISKSTKDKENTEEIEYHTLNNKIKGICAQSSEEAADKVARGASTAVQLWDEFDFYKHIAITHPIALAATDKARENAKKVGLPYSNLMASTIGYTDAEEFQFANNLRSNAMFFYDQLYDCECREELVDTIKKNSTNQMALVMYSYLQLGETREWLKEVRARSSASEEQFNREYLLIPSSGSGDDGIPVHLLKILRDNQMDPVHTDRTIDRYIQHWYITKEFKNSHAYKGGKYILGLDSSEGIGNDWISTVLVDASDLSVTSTFRINEVNIAKLGKYIAKFLIDNENVIWIPERKSTGRDIIDIVLMEFQKHGINPYKRIYNEVVQNLGDTKYKDISIHDFSNIADSKNRKVFGFATTGSGSSSRDKLYSDTLFRTLETNGTRIRDKALINEYCGLKIRNGRLDHKVGGNDDTVTAHLLACYLVYFGKNLHIYGLDERNLLSRVDARGNQIEHEAKTEKERILNRIQELESLIKTTTSTFLTNSYKRELNHLRSMDQFIPGMLDEREPVIIDEMQPKQTTDVDKTREFYKALTNARTNNTSRVPSRLWF
jgi:hypothetical protein